MSILVLLLNLVACGVIWVAAMYFYLKHDAPRCAGQHYGQVALILVAVGAFALIVQAVRLSSVDWWTLLFRLGLAMVAGRSLLRAWRERGAAR